MGFEASNWYNRPETRKVNGANQDNEIPSRCTVVQLGAHSMFQGANCGMSGKPKQRQMCYVKWNGVKVASRNYIVNNF